MKKPIITFLLIYTCLNLLGQIYTPADPYFVNGNQPNLYTRIPGNIDINALEAWQYTKGNSNITIAVIDEGINTNHGDFQNLSPYSYDCHYGGNNIIKYGNTQANDDTKYHGTAVAGIISAAHNGYAIAGIAPDCPLMAISIDLDPPAPGTPGNFEVLPNGIEFARNNGASIINISTGVPLPQTIMTQMDIDLMNDIDHALKHALNQGRNGLGCVIIASTGNRFTENVLYPANHDGVIAVVSCNQSGTAGGSNYLGGQVDLSAPGFGFTLANSKAMDGYETLPSGSGVKGVTGSSFAAPQVAAVAGLVLSIQPCLTNTEVEFILESSAQKLPDYTFSETVGRPNGTWNEKMGYGAVDAEAAVIMAQNYRLSVNFDCEKGELSTPNTDGFSYQWYLDGTLISGANYNTYIPNKAGTYTVMRTHSNTGCTVSSEEYVLPNMGYTADVIVCGSNHCQRIGPVSPLSSDIIEKYEWYVNEGTPGSCEATYSIIEGETNTAMCVLSGSQELGTYSYKRVLTTLGGKPLEESYYTVEFRNSCAGINTYFSVCCEPGQIDPSVSYPSGSPNFSRGGSGAGNGPCNEAVLLYPNPGDGKFQVKVTGPVNENDRVQVIDLQGNLIVEKFVYNNTPIDLDMSSENKGLYKVVLICNEGVQTLMYEKNQ